MKSFVITLVSNVHLTLFPPSDVLPPQPTPKFDGPGAQAGLELVAQIAGIAFICLVVGAFVSGIAIGFGRWIKQGTLQTVGFWGVVGCVAGAAVCGSAFALINWGANVRLI